MRVLFSAGEASGDAYGGALLSTLRKGGQVEAEALGGRRLEAAGARLLADSSDWGAIGVAEAFRVFPRANRGRLLAQRALASGPPGIFVPIDYGYLNIRLCRFAKSHGWKVVYFSPPGAWRRDRQGEDLPHVTDAVVTPFSWSAEILRMMGANAHWFGHPIKQMIRDSGGNAVEPGPRRGVAILPGSRRAEIALLLPVFAKALDGLEAAAEFAVAPTVDGEAIRRRWAGLAPARPSDTFTVGDTYGVLRRARAAIVCSGTATLEAALCRCPHIIVYKVTRAVEAQARLMRFKVPLIGQLNILLDRMVAKELIQYDASPEAIRAEVDRLLEDETARQEQLTAFAELDALLGRDDAIDRSAELIWEIALG